MENKKYELVKEDSIVKSIIEINDTVVYRIKALRDIPKYNVKKGDLGGYIEKEYNLSHEGNCWIGDNATVCHDTRVRENAYIYDKADIWGNADIYGNAKIHDNTDICGSATIYGDADIGYGRPTIFGGVIEGHTKISGYPTIYEGAFIVGNSLISTCEGKNFTISRGFYNDAHIESNNDYCTLITPDGEYTFYKDINGDYSVFLGGVSYNINDEFIRNSDNEILTQSVKYAKFIFGLE